MTLKSLCVQTRVRKTKVTKSIKCTHSHRVRTHGQVEGWRGGVPLAGQRTTMAGVGMNMKEVPAFFQMAAAPGITMKIRGTTTGTTFTSLLNEEPFCLQGG